MIKPRKVKRSGSNQSTDRFFFSFFFLFATCERRERGYSNRVAISLFSHAAIKLFDSPKTLTGSFISSRARAILLLLLLLLVNLVSSCNINAATAAAVFIIKSYITHIQTAKDSE